jgi:hypothetical protein
MPNEDDDAVRVLPFCADEDPDVYQVRIEEAIARALAFDPMTN